MHAHHRWQRSILGLSWKDRITNAEVRTRTGQQTMTSKHTERKTTSLAWTCFPYGPQAHTTASTVLAGTRIQERTRSTKSELEGRNQQRPTKDGVHLEGSRGGSFWQTRMASECGLMCPVGCGMNRGQGSLARRHCFVCSLMMLRSQTY